MLPLHSQAPDLEIETHLGYRGPLSHFWRDGPLILFFYPKDNTPTCTKQACALQSSIAEFGRFHANVLGANNDSADSHRAFAGKNDLAFPIVADRGGQLARAYQAFRRLIHIPKRITYVIDVNGRIIAAVHKEFNVAAHLDAVRQALDGGLDSTA